MTRDGLIAFEAGIKDLWEAGDLPFLMHLCGGNEDPLMEIFEQIGPGDWVFSTHRSHYHYLLKGGSEERLMQLIKAGRSMFIFDKELKFFTSSILAGICCIASGVAYGLKENGSANAVWCFLGDGAEDQGHFYEAVMFAMAQDLPIRFVIEDNDRSVDTTKQQRRGDFEFQWPDKVIRYEYNPTYPHAGSGCKHHIVFK